VSECVSYCAIECEGLATRRSSDKREEREEGTGKRKTRVERHEMKWSVTKSNMECDKEQYGA